MSHESIPLHSESHDVDEEFEKRKYVAFVGTLGSTGNLTLVDTPTSQL